MHIQKKNGTYTLWDGTTFLTEINKTSDFVKKDLIAFNRDSGYFQVVGIQDSHNSNLKNGEIKYNLTKVEVHDLICQKYSVTML